MPETVAPSCGRRLVGRGRGPGEKEHHRDGRNPASGVHGRSISTCERPAVRPAIPRIEAETSETFLYVVGLPQARVISLGDTSVELPASAPRRGTCSRRVSRAALLLALALPATGRSAPWWQPERVLLQAGQAFDPPSVRFAEFAGVAVARDVPLAGRLGGSVELYPLLVFNQTRPDHVTRERVAASCLSPLFTFDIGARQGSWGLRGEVGIGFFYGYRPVPAVGSRFNFYDQLGARLVHRLVSGRAISLGYRYVHISNLGLVGSANPGFSLHAAVAAFDW